MLTFECSLCFRWIRYLLYHCATRNGASRSGLYVAVSILLERLKLEKEIDVFQTVKQLRLCRSHLVDNLVSIYESSL